MTKILRISFTLLGAALLIMFLIPLLWLGILNAGNAVGIVISCATILCSVFSERIYAYFKKLCNSKFGKIITYVIAGIIILCIIFAVYAGIKIASAMNNPPNGSTTAIVLGCKVNPGGPSLMLKYRIDTAYQFLKDNPKAKCIVSGGKGDDEPMSEAECMYKELNAMGIDKNRIYMEDKSTNTRENIQFSKEIIANEGLPPEMPIITNDFHQYRAREIARMYDIISYSVSGRTPVSMFPTYFLREIGGVLYELIF